MAYLTIDSNTAFEFGTGNFTIECWVNLLSYPESFVNSGAVLFDNRPSLTTGSYPTLYINYLGEVEYLTGTTVRISNTSLQLKLGTWYHIALVRISGTTKLYINGTQSGSSYSDSENYLTDNVLIGASYVGTSTLYSFLKGNLSNYRIVKGVGVYTNTFTPSTSPLTATQSAGTNINAITGTQTSLLTCQTAGIVDASTYHFSITSSNASINDGAPFDPPSTFVSWIQASGGNTFGYTMDNQYEVYASGNNAAGQISITARPDGQAILQPISSPIQIGATYFSASPVQIGNNSWNKISSGSKHVIALKSDNTLWSWGINTYGQLGDGTYDNRSSPTQISSGTSWNNISAGDVHSIATDSTDKLYQWGPEYYPGTNVRIAPTKLYTITSFTNSSNSNNGAFIRSDGALYVWGNNSAGLLGLNNVIHRSYPIQLGISSWTAVASTLSTVIAIRADGGLFTWGVNSSGCLGDNTPVATTRSSPVQIGTSSWISVSATFNNVVALRRDGSVFAWGANESGQLGVSDIVSRSSPVQVGTSSWSFIASGYNASFAIRTDGSLWAWGVNNFGQLGISLATNRSSPVQIGTSSWSSVSARTNVIALRFDNTLWSWGENTNGSLGINSTLSRSSPVQIGTSSWTVANTAEYTAAAIRSDGALFLWGINTYGQLGNNSIIARSSPVQLGTASWTSVAGTFFNYFGVTGGELFGWGNNAAGTLGDLTIIHRSSPVQVSTTLNDPFKIGNSSWTQVSAGFSHNLAIRSDGGLFGWGNYASNEFTSIFSYDQVEGAYHTLAIRNNGSLWSWGINSIGQLGDPSLLSRSSPVQVGTSSWTKLSAGLSESFAIRNDGLLFAWGLNSVGQLGDNTIASKSSPTQIGSSIWSAISTPSGSTVAAIRSDGKLFTWGNNGAGILGRLDIINRSSPTQLGTSNWSSVTVGSAHMLAIADNGVLWAWGSNATGQLGDGTITNRSSPVQISTITTEAEQNNYALYTGETVYSWNQINVGASQAIALRSDGLLFTWGANTFGQLGVSGYLSTAIVPVPQQVGSSSWTYVGSGNSHNVAIRADGALFTWGANENGQLGLGDLIHRSSPTQVGTMSWSQVVAGSQHNIATTSTNNVYLWGINTDGQLGLNDAISRSLPTQLAASGNGFNSVFLTTGTDRATITNTFALGTGDFTFECWVFLYKATPISGGERFAVLGTTNSGPLGTYSFYCWIEPQSGTLYARLGIPNGYMIHPSIVVKSNTWYHIAVTRVSSTTLQGWVNGTPTSTVTPGGNFANYTIATNQLGSTLYGGNSLTGLISNLRILDYNLYTSSFTPPTGPLEPIPGTRLLTAQQPTLYETGPTYTGSMTASLGSPTAVRVAPDTFAGPALSAVKIGAGTNTSSYTDNVGALYIWGNNTAGQLGTNEQVHRSSPVQITTIDTLAQQNTYVSETGLTNIYSWTTVSSGFSHTVGIRNDGSLWTWGQAQSGQLGNNSNANTINFPIKIGTSSWTTATANQTNSVGIRNDGLLFVWGDNTTGQLGFSNLVHRSSPTQLGTSSWNQAVAGVGSIFGISVDNLLYGIGNNANGLLGLNNTVHRSSPTQIGTSSWTNVFTGPLADNIAGIRADGALFTWGINTGGSMGIGDTIARSSPTQIGTDSWTTVAVGGTYMAALNAGGILYAWGFNSNGQLGIGNTVSRSSPVQLTTLAGIETNIDSYVSAVGYAGTVYYSWISIATGSNANYAIRSDGMLFAWGLNSAGQLGLGNTVDKSFPEMVGTSSWIMVTAGASTTTTGFALAIRADNALFGWGFGNNGQLGFNDILNRSSPVQVGTSSWNFVAAGGQGTFGILSNSTLWYWGTGSNGVSGLGNTVNRSSPTQIGTDSWITVSAGGNANGAGIKIDGSLYTWGTGTSGVLGNNSTTPRSSPTQIGTQSWIAVSAQFNTMFGITADGMLYAWGDNTVSKLGLNNTIHRSSPTQIGTSSWTFVWGTDQTTFGINTDGLLYAWGYSTQGELGNGSTATASSPVAIGTSSWTLISGGHASNINGSNHISGIRADGRLFVWGNNGNGQLGNLRFINVSSPIVITTFVESWSAIAASNSTVAGVRADGLLFTWGGNAQGEVGDGTIAHRSVPVQIGNSTWSNVFGKYNNISALTNNGQLFRWGNNTNGVIGNTKFVPTSYSSPVFLKSINESWVALGLGVGATHTAIVRNDGPLFVFGNNNGGQLGLNDRISRSNPTQLGTSSWINVSVAGSTISVISNNNMLWTWGTNGTGQLGLSDTISRSSPVQVGTSSWSSIASGVNMNYMIKPNGSLFGSGSTGQGELGITRFVGASSPTFIRTVTDSWTSVQAGQSGTHTIGIRRDGLAFVWGSNTNGEIGINSISHRSAPVQLGTSSWTLVSAGFNSTVAKTVSNAVFVWGLNTTGQLGFGDIINRSSPVQLSSLNYKDIKQRNTVGLYIRNDGVLLGTGYNSNGGLGQLDIIHRSSPVQVGAISAYYNTLSYSEPTQIGTSSWSQISATNNYSFAVRTDNVLFAWGGGSNYSVTPTLTNQGYSVTAIGTGPNDLGFIKKP